MGGLLMGRLERGKGGLCICFEWINEVRIKAILLENLQYKGMCLENGGFTK